MRILMFGRGAIATVYGLAFQESGHDVDFYVRPGRAAQYGSDVRTDIIDARRAASARRLRRTSEIRLRESLDTADGYDLVVLSVAHQRLSEASEFLAPRIGDATVLVFGNVWDEPQAATGTLPTKQVVFGFPQAGGGFTQGGVLHGALFRSVTIGQSAATPNARELIAHRAFREAGFTVHRELDIRGWLLIHFATDAGMFSQGIHSGSLANMIGNRRALRSALLTSRELLPVLRARGVELRRHRRAIAPLRAPALTSTAMAWATARIPIAQVSLAAHTDPFADEPRAVMRDALHTAHQLGIPAPRLEAAQRIVEHHLDAPQTSL